MELNIGVQLQLETRAGTAKYSFQNYKIGASVSDGVTYTFAPFQFSGTVTNLDGDNIEAGLVFPANKVTRSWAEQALRESWVAKVAVKLLKDDSSIKSTLYTYTGAVSSGGWGEVQLELSLTGIMDATRASVPARKYIRELVGRIPITAALNV